MQIDIGPLPAAADPAAPAPRGMARLERWPYNTAALFLFIGMVLLAIGLTLAYVEYLYRTQGRVTDAVVLRTWGTGAKANAQYRFTLPDGEIVTSTQGHFRPHRRDIRVVYVPAHPFLSRVAPPDDARPHDGYMTLTALGLGSLLLGAHLARQTRKKLRAAGAGQAR